MAISNLEQAFYIFCRVNNPSETKLSLDNFLKVSNDLYEFINSTKSICYFLHINFQYLFFLIKVLKLYSKYLL